VTTAVDCDELEETFAKMEVFLAVFSEDENIINASIALLACVLDATERTIVYFCSRAGPPALS